VFTVQWSVWLRKFHKYVKDSYKIGIFYNIIISFITVDKGKKVAPQAATAVELLCHSLTDSVGVYSLYSKAKQKSKAQL